MESFTFDYGGEIAAQEVHFKVWPTVGQRTALIDADLLPYVVGYTTDPLKELQAKAAVEDGWVPCITDTQEYNDAFEQMCSTLNHWVTDSGCDSALLYCTASENNYRLAVAFTDPYKGTRRAEKPPFFYELKEALVSKLCATISDGEEADDLLGHEIYRRNQLLLQQGVVLGTQMHKELTDFVCVSSDKDLRTKPCTHYEPRTGKFIFTDVLGRLEPKYNKTGGISDLKGTGRKFFYAQLIMGDAVDNYKGIPKKGPKAAYDALVGCNSERECYDAVLKMYREKYGLGLHTAQSYRGGNCQLTAYQRMLEQGRLAWIQDWKRQVWRDGKGHTPSGEDASAWT